MIPVAEALEKVLALAAPLAAEQVPLAEAAGRVMCAPVSARRDQPPFDSAAMDGYAIAGHAGHSGARFRVIGEAAAGHAYQGHVGAGETVRIFTGAPLPRGTDRVIIQEDVTTSVDSITLGQDPGASTHVRARGGDFSAGSTLEAPRRLGASDLALLAAMNIATVPVTRRPAVAIMATGDELVMPGEAPRADQIIASNIFALKAIVEAEGGEARLLPIARDSTESLRSAFGLAAGADLIVTIGGASVGDHDLIVPVADELGMERAFYKIAMRPGKPLIAGRLGAAAMLGMPGNPVSAIVCAHLFLRPALRRMLGLDDVMPRHARARTATDLPANGARAHYMRARLEPGDGLPAITPFERQDSALLSVLTAADALLVRPAGDPPRAAGEIVDYLPL